jgi:elongation factor P
MSLIEGHSNYVMNRIGAQQIPQFAQLQRRMEARQQQRPTLDNLIMHATGMHVKMAQYSTGDLKPGYKVEVEGEPYNVVSNEFVKPGKGQPFNRVKLKHLKTARVVEKTFKSGEKVDVADVEENKMRMLYKEADDAIFMDDKTFDQVSISLKLIGSNEQWLMEEVLYDIVFYKGQPIDVQPPTFMELKITETAPGVRGDTSGRVLKAAMTESGAKVQVPIFIEEGEKIKVDTRTGEYVSRV